MIVAPSFALEDQVQRFAITIDPTPLIYGSILGGFGIAGSFEYAPIPNASGKVNVFYVGAKMNHTVYTEYEDEDSSEPESDSAGTSLDFSFLKFTLEGRFYPVHAAPRGLFLGGGYGFNKISASFFSDWADQGKIGGSLYFHTLFLNIGYKVCFGREPRVPLFIEPSLSYNFLLNSSLGKIEEQDPFLSLFLGAKGAAIGLTIGVAF
jgi:hypothetical protein